MMKESVGVWTKSVEGESVEVWKCGSVEVWKCGSVISVISVEM